MGKYIVAVVRKQTTEVVVDAPNSSAARRKAAGLVRLPPEGADTETKTTVRKAGGLGPGDLIYLSQIRSPATERLILSTSGFTPGGGSGRHGRGHVLPEPTGCLQTKTRNIQT